MFVQLFRALAPEGSLWRHRDYMRLFAGSTLATLGAAVSQMALPLTAVQVLGASATQMGVLAAFEALPFALFCLPAGVWVDRARKRGLAAGFNFLAAVALALVPLAYLGGWLSLGLLYAVGFAVGSSFAVGGTAMQVFITQLVGRERLVEANSKLSAASSVAGIAGPALAALLVSWLSAPIAISADALGFAMSGLLILSIQRDDAPLAQASASMLREVASGLRLVWDHALLRALAVSAALWIMMFDAFRALYVLFATRDLSLGSGDLALINTLGAAGALLGAALAHRFEARLGPRPLLLVGFLVSGLGYGLYVLSPSGLGVSALIAGLAMLVIDLGATLYSVTYISLRQHVTPDAMLGKMTATMRFLTVSSAPVGSILAGVAGDRFGLRAVFVALALGGVLLAVAVMRWMPLAGRPAKVRVVSASV